MSKTQIFVQLIPEDVKIEGQKLQKVYNIPRTTFGIKIQLE